MILLFYVEFHSHYGSIGVCINDPLFLTYYESKSKLEYIYFSLNLDNYCSSCNILQYYGLHLILDPSFFFLDDWKHSGSSHDFV